MCVNIFNNYLNMLALTALYKYILYIFFPSNFKRFETLPWTTVSSLHQPNDIKQIWVNIRMSLMLKYSIICIDALQKYKFLTLLHFLMIDPQFENFSKGSSTVRAWVQFSGNAF